MIKVFSPHLRAPDRLELLLSLLVIHNLARMVFSTSTGFLLGKKQGEVDGWMFLSGLSVLLTQYNPRVSSSTRDFHSWGQRFAQYTFTGDWWAHIKVTMKGKNVQGLYGIDIDRPGRQHIKRSHP